MRVIFVTVETEGHFFSFCSLLWLVPYQETLCKDVTNSIQSSPALQKWGSSWANLAVIRDRARWYPGQVTTGSLLGHNHTHHKATSSSQVHVSGMLKEAGENPHRHRKNRKTRHRNALARNQTHNCQAVRRQRQPLNTTVVIQCTLIDGISDVLTVPILGSLLPCCYGHLIGLE